MRWCCCCCPRQSCSVLTIFLLTGVSPGGEDCQLNNNNILQAYNLIQLACIATTKLEEAASHPSLGNTTYPSILVPPSLDPGLVLLYNNITMVINGLVILSCLCAGLAICKVIKSLRAFLKTNVPQTAGLQVYTHPALPQINSLNKQ